MPSQWNSSSVSPGAPLGIGDFAGGGDPAGIVVGELEVVHRVPDERQEEAIAGDAEGHVLAGQLLDRYRVHMGIVQTTRGDRFSASSASPAGDHPASPSTAMAATCGTCLS